MKNKLFLILVMTLFIVLSSSSVAAREDTPSGPAALVGSGISYQGRLEDDTGPYNGSCDFRFELYGSYTGTDQIGSTLTRTGGMVSDGYFYVAQLDFGSGAFKGEDRWLRIEVRCPAGEGEYIALSPRQAIRAVPYALSLPGLYTTPGSEAPNIIGGSPYNQVQPGVFGGTVSGGGAGSGYNYVFDHVGTVSGGANNQAGSDDSDPWSGDGATVGGGWNNIAASPITTVAGGANHYAGGYAATIGGGEFNIAEGEKSTIGGGSANTTQSLNATISGGITNTIKSDAGFSTIGGGGENLIETGWVNTIGGGYSNYIEGEANTIAGGAGNIAVAEDNAFIGGGYGNETSGSYSAVTGGITNTITITGTYGVIGGGAGNTVDGQGATVPGGGYNTAAGDYSLAAGRNAQANHDGSFVWSDSSSDQAFASNRDNQFRVKADGGVEFQDGSGNWVEFLWDDAINTSTGASLSLGGTWTNASDVNLKENFSHVDSIEVLDKLATIPSQSWNYKSEGDEVRHIGPMAQDFYAAFALGGSDRAISTVDADGVSLAAIQGLYTIAQDQAATIDRLQSENDQLAARLSALEGGSGKPFQWRSTLPWVLSGLLACLLVVVLVRGVAGIKINLQVQRRE